MNEPQTEETVLEAESVELLMQMIDEFIYAIGDENIKSVQIEGNQARILYQMREGGKKNGTQREH